jgi:hypothetical protein
MLYDEDEFTPEPSPRFRSSNGGPSVLSVLIGLGVVAALAVILTTCPGCRGPVKTWVGGVVSCSTDAVKANWPRAYPEVQRCLVSLEVDPIVCLDAIPTVLSIGIDVVACIVRGSGQEAASQANANPDDIASRRKADRASTYLIAKGFQFQE